MEHGFVSPKPGKWVKEHCESSRPMIEIRHYKGATSAPIWGFSLNYAPHFNNSLTKLNWHRTVKSAKLDIFPFDEFNDGLNISRFASVQEHETIVADVLRSALGRATTFFDSVSSTEDLLPIFERLRAFRGSGIGYCNYSNVPLAHAFTLRVNDRSSEGKLILDEYVRRMNVPDAALNDLWHRFEHAKI